MRVLRLLCLIESVLVVSCGHHDPAPSDPSRSERTPSASTDVSGQSPSDLATLNRKQTVSVRPESLPYITVREIHPEAFAGTISAPARVEFRAKAVSTAGTVVAGRVTQVHVQIGDRIKAGASLATLASGEAAQMRSDFARAQAELARAQDRLRRQREMQLSGVGLEVERVEAETQLKEARAEFERSRDFLRLLGEGDAGEVVVRAPMDSVVLKAHVSVGAAVGAGSPLFELGQPSAAWIVADVFEKDLLLVEIGAKVVIELASLPDPIRGHVVAESAAIQTELRRASVFIEPDDPKIPLRPGMYARVSIEASAPNQIILPTTAVLIKDGRETVVYVEVAPGAFEARPVQVGQAREGMTPVLKGLSGGERVVVGGALLVDGEAAMLL
jgi:cobalt-zinc-cadmium efflux system membrane fusion protein